ncbi:MAG: hypothetical protein GY827_05940 [Cytophagales bacterium]|nr:hypothetical protein [Cytophagales bacterium]
MIDAVTTNLSKEILHKMSIHDIVYAESTAPGGMGNSGGIIIYIFENNNLICYETNIHMNESLYDKADDLLLNHSKRDFINQTQGKTTIFNLYDAGMGNCVFLNRNMEFETKEEYSNYFTINKNNKKYKIFSSVPPVFKVVAFLISTEEYKK